MTEIENLPNQLDDALSLQEVRVFATALNLEPDNVFSPTDIKIIQLQKIHKAALRKHIILNYLVEAHDMAPQLPISNQLHLIMLYPSAFTDDEITSQYVEHYARPDGTHTETNKEAQARKIQEYYKSSEEEEAFFEMVARRFKEVRNYPFLHPSYQYGPPLPEIPTINSTPTPINPDPVVPEYLDFDIIVRPLDKLSGKYPISARSDNRGTPNNTLQALPSDSKFVNTLEFLQSFLVHEKDIAQLGNLIYAFLFPTQVRELFLDVKSRHDKIRVRINIPAESNELHQIPWEYIRDDSAFLGTALDTPVVRSIPTQQIVNPLLIQDQQIRVLVALASPADQPEIKIEDEVSSINQMLGPLVKQGRMNLKILEHATKQELMLEFIDFRPHIFHFVGHGGTKADGEGLIWLENSQGNATELDAENLRDLIKTADRATKLVIFAACQSGVAGPGAENVTNGGFMGLGPRILQEVPAVIAMQYMVPQTIAFAFTKNVYSRVFGRRDHLDKAVTLSRLMISMSDEKPIYWGLPVLFMRSPDGRIW